MIKFDIVTSSPLWYMAWYGKVCSTLCYTYNLQPSARKHSFLFLGLFQPIKSTYHHFKHPAPPYIVSNASSWYRFKLEVTLSLVSKYQRSPLRRLLIISMIGFNSLSYEKFSAGNKERGGESFVGFAARAEILFL